ncbi:MAG: TolC family protein, partial [Fidelibacterota bacterium]
RSVSDLSFLPYNSPATIDVSNSVSSSKNSSIGLSSVLFSGGKNYYTWEKLKKAGEVGKVQKQQAMENTTVAVIKAYYRITSLKDNLNIARKALEISKQRLERIANKVELGSALKLEQLNSEVDMNTDSINVLNALLQLENAKRNLNFILGREIETEFTVVDSVEFYPEKKIEDWRKTAFEHNTSLKEARLQLEQSRYDVKIARAAYFPVISGTAAYNNSQSESEGGQWIKNEQSGMTTGLNVSVDLFSGFRKKNNLQNANIGVRSKKEALDLSLGSLETEIMNAYATYKNALFTVKSEEKNLEIAKMNFDRTRESYRLGQVTTTQFREAQLNWIRAEQRLIDEKYTAKFAEVELYRLSGTLADVYEIKP